MISYRRPSLPPPIAILGWLSHRQPRIPRIAVVIVGALGISAARHNIAASCPICQEDGPSSGPNVLWSLTDSLSACPAGDSVFSGPPTNRRPSRLRINVWYNDNDCSPKPRIPPDSIYVTWATATGNARVNDTGAQIFADDTTNVCGHARITISSFSGCGKLTIQLFVHQYLIGTKTVVVRTTDTNGDGRVTSADVTNACDLDYDGVAPPDANDIQLVVANTDHWHRNALHGTLVRRTNYCETCPEEALNTRGEGQVAWSPSQRFIAYTAFVDAGSGNEPSCKVFLVPSDPGEGNALTRFTSAPIFQHDYDPSWSPQNTEIVFDRADSVVIRKQVPWLGTTETTVTASNNLGCGNERGDDVPAISPDGQWVAFSRCNGDPTGGWSIWKTPVGGGTATQLTSTAGRADFYASWSPDGQTIYFQRQDAAIGPQITLWKVPAAGGDATAVFIPPSSPDIFDAVQPASSPDGRILVSGLGKRSLLVRNVVTHTLDPALTSPTSSKLIANYPDTMFAEKGDFPILSPRLSPDGTRLAVGSKQVWAARRNMSLPPRITQVGGQNVADTTARVFVTAIRGLQTTLQVVSSDPEGDPITCAAFFLQDGMTFNQSNCTLSWTPSAPAGTTFVVKFVVSTNTWPKESGGTDAILVILTVSSGLDANAVLAHTSGSGRPDGPNPTHGEFAITSPLTPGTEAVLAIFDPAGRRVANLRAPSGRQLVWDGRDAKGSSVAPGVYLYRLEVGANRQEGRIVVFR